MDATPTLLEKIGLIAADLAADSAENDRTGRIAPRVFSELAKTGLLGLTVSKAHGGAGAGMRETADVLRVLGKADPSVALILAMHFIQHLIIARTENWPRHLAQKLVRDATGGVGLINALRVEPEQGSPARGGLPATVARRTAEGWRLTGRKIYSTGAPVLRWYLVWARTDEPDVRLGIFLVPAGLPGTRIVETWDHLGLRASGSHDVIFDDVLFPLDHEIDVRKSEQWLKPDVIPLIIHPVLTAAVYDGVAQAARDWLLQFLKTRAPSSLGAPLATLPRAQDIAGGIDAKLAVNARLIRTFVRDFDDGITVTPNEAAIVKLMVTNNAVSVVEDALSLSSNHGLSRTNPLERHYRDVLCGRVHTPQDDSTRITAGRAALGI
ncbi:acyl-CoA dehydrogenase family protein [Bradyrhizobium sp. G127]|uniref:acyl-CoA dehydrogenase family protein n=1 Tax=Bradyrhizobium sp. G127 TaxID=2904800 RepID=UPI001F413A3F|nr:acyl-CoA dehydrogenase family protein [Bradyrhizobium sp. G127]MCF2524690.1 acyl-CoA/acyl-ACP dehydrogenase [Bradyrhizobium sp. G127]